MTEKKPQQHDRHASPEQAEAGAEEEEDRNDEALAEARLQSNVTQSQVEEAPAKDGLDARARSLLRSIENAQRSEGSRGHREGRGFEESVLVRIESIHQFLREHSGANVLHSRAQDQVLKSLRNAEDIMKFSINPLLANAQRGYRAEGPNSVLSGSKYEKQPTMRKRRRTEKPVDKGNRSLIDSEEID